MMDVVSKEFNTNTSSVQLCASPKTENVNMMTKIKNVGGNTFVQSNSEKFFFFLNNNNTANISEIHKIFMVGLSWVWINKFIQ